MWQQRGLILVLLAALTLGVYGNSLKNGFHYDDFHAITENHWIRTLSNSPLFFTSGSVLSYDPNAIGYRPLLLESYAINYAMSHLDPWGYHLLQVILHVCTVLLVYGLVWQIHKNQKMAVLAAVLFGLHPANTEAVNYLTARSSLMSGMLTLLALWCYIYFRSASGEAGRRHILAYISAVVAFTLAILTKESAIILPFLLVASDYYFLLAGRSRPYSRQILWYLPFVFIGGIYLVIRHLLVGAIPVLPAYPTDTTLNLFSDMLLKFLTVLKIFARYLLLFIWPISLNVDYPFAHTASLFEGETLFSIALIGCLLVGIWVLFSRARWLSFCGLWFLVALLPIGMLPLFTNIALFQENRGYLASVSFAMALSWGYFRLPVQGKFRGLKESLIVILCIGYGLAVVSRNAVWRDEVTLWSDTLKKNPQSVMAYLNLGFHYYRQEQWELAAQANQAALRLVPNEPKALNNLGMVYYNQGRLDEAENIFREAANLYPQDPKIHNNFGLYFSKVERYDEAISEYQEAIRLSPKDWRTLLNLGWTYARQNQWNMALDTFQRARSINAASAEIFTALGAAYTALGKTQDTQQSLEHALAIDPTLVSVHQQLGELYIQQGQILEAVKLMEALLELDPQNAEAHHALGYLSEQQKKFEDALKHYREAIRIDPKRYGSYFNLGNVYWRFGETDLALQAYQKVLELEPNFLSARFNMAKVFENSGRWREAIEQYRLVLNQAGLRQDPTMQRQAKQSLDKLAQALQAGINQTKIPQKVPE